MSNYISEIIVTLQINEIRINSQITKSDNQCVRKIIRFKCLSNKCLFFNKFLNVIYFMSLETHHNLQNSKSNCKTISFLYKLITWLESVSMEKIDILRYWDLELKHSMKL